MEFSTFEKAMLENRVEIPDLDWSGLSIVVDKKNKISYVVEYCRKDNLKGYQITGWVRIVRPWDRPGFHMTSRGPFV